MCSKSNMTFNLKNPRENEADRTRSCSTLVDKTLSVQIRVLHRARDLITKTWCLHLHRLEKLISELKTTFLNLTVEQTFTAESAKWMDVRVTQFLIICTTLLHRVKSAWVKIKHPSAASVIDRLLIFQVINRQLIFQASTEGPEVVPCKANKPILVA
jgi:hypothetical protein